MNGFGNLRPPWRVKPSGVKPSGVKPSRVKPSGVKPSGVKPSGVDRSQMMSSGFASAEIAPTGRLGERGSATIFVVGFALVLFAAAGLAIDGGRAINARDKATDIAEQAARTGADQLDKDALRDGGGAVLDQVAAKLAADDFVRAAGYTPDSTTDVNTVTVRAAATYTTTLLGIVGINTIDVSGVATASPDVGINGATP